MKTVLKIAAVVTAFLAVAGVVLVFWDKIMDLFDRVADKMEEKKANKCLASEFDDYDEEIELYQ